MNRGTGKKVIETAVVLFSLVAAVFVYQWVDPERFIKPDQTPVTAAETAAAPQESYTGRVAGEDIARVSGKEDIEKLTGNTYVTAEPVSVIETGIYSLNPWVDPYEITKMRNSSGRMVSSGRRAPEVTDSALEALEYYQEYYLIELPDGSMVPAQFPASYKDAIEKKEAVTLPIGVRKTNSSEAKRYLAEICETYGADNTYTLYMIDDQWQQEHDFTFFIIRFGIAAAVFLVLAVGLLTVYYKADN